MPGAPARMSAAAGPEEPGHRGQRLLEVHLVKRGVGADEVEAGLGQRIGEEVRLGEPQPAPAPGTRPGPPDHPRVPVDPGDLGTALREQQASIPSPQPTSSAWPQLAGTAARMADW